MNNSLPIELLKIFSARGSVSRIARELGISQSSLYFWKKVPAERVIDLERITGIPREILRPDIFKK